MLAEAQRKYLLVSSQSSKKPPSTECPCNNVALYRDLGLIQVEDASLPRLRQINAVSGVGIGSTVIDGAFQVLVQKRLDSHPDGYSLPQTLPRKMAKSTQFQSVKHKFGSPAADFAEFPFKLDILGRMQTLPRAFTLIWSISGVLRLKILPNSKIFPF